MKKFAFEDFGFLFLNDCHRVIKTPVFRLRDSAFESSPSNRVYFILLYPVYSRLICKRG
jgi:hypothetical protein